MTSRLICLSSPSFKNIPVFLRGKSPAYLRHPVPVEGTLAIVTDVGAGCGGRGSVVARFFRADERRLCPAKPFGGDGWLRTAKSCGPDAPMLAFKPAMMLRITRVTVTRKPGRRGEHEISRKTIAQGRPDCLR
jgi:hypothetical protein